MREPFFEEYELRVTARIAAPMDAGDKLSQSIFETIQAALAQRKDMLTAITSVTLQPVERKDHERSKTGF